MTEKTVPTLSSKGWLYTENVHERLDALLAYAFTSDNSQSVTFEDEIFSVQWILSKFGKSSIELQSNLQQGFTNYLRPHFDSIDVTVRVEEGDTETEMGIKVQGYVVQDGGRYSLAQTATIRDGAVVAVVNALNNQETV